MKKIILYVSMILIISIFNNVKANEYYEVYSELQKGENSGKIYNIMPTEVKRGDIITVKIVLKNGKGWNVNNGYNNIKWDNDAFEIVETNGEYVKIINDNITYVWSDLNRDNGIKTSFSYDDNYKVLTNDEELLELKFRVKKNAKDGIYKIYQDIVEEGITLKDDDEYLKSWSFDSTLQYQIGKEKNISNFSIDNISNNTYIIGDYLFNREGSDKYDGILTTQHIMLASKSIESDNTDDMIIYFKNARGNWVNAISGEPLEKIPDNFKITYVNMIASYQENGIYADSNNSTRLRFVQINDKEAIVTIENDQVSIHGFASISNNIIRLKVNNIDYVMTISDNEINIETSDSLITSKKLQKISLYSINDYFADNYGKLGWGDGDSDRFRYAQYFKSEQTAKYTSDKYELYLYRMSNEDAWVCLKEKNASSCLISSNVFGTGVGYTSALDEATYAFFLDDTNYGLSLTENQIDVKCEGACINQIEGVYTKESSLTMEDIFKVMEKNDVSYNVVINENNDSEPWNVWILNGETVNDYFEDYDLEPSYKEGYKFVGWQVDEKDYDLDTPVTKSIILSAKWEIDIVKPELGDGLDYNYYRHSFFIANLNDYCIADCDKIPDGAQYNVDGFEIYEKTGNTYQLFSVKTNNVVKNEFPAYENISFIVTPGTKKSYAIRTFIKRGNEKVYSDYSDEVEVDATFETPVISFAKGTSDGPDYVAYENNHFVYNINVDNNRCIAQYSDSSCAIYNIDGVAVYEKGSNIPIKNVLPGDPIEVKVYKGNKTVFYVKTYAYDGDGNPVYSDFSNELEATGLPTPILSAGVADNGWAALTIHGEGTYALSDSIIDGYDIYLLKNGVYNLINNESKVVTENGTYVARAYILNGTEKIYSDYSNELVFNGANLAPIIMRSIDGLGDESSENRARPLVYNEQKNAFAQDLNGDYSIHMDSDYELVDDYEWFEKNGESLTSVYDGGFGGEARVYISEGSKKTFVAKAYTHYDENKKAYSPESNEITIDLTNPVYTFETVSMESDSNKMIVRAYINGYEVSFNNIIIGETSYSNASTGMEFVASKNVIENVNSIGLKLSDNKVVTASRKTN